MLAIGKRSQQNCRGRDLSSFLSSDTMSSCIRTLAVTIYCLGVVALLWLTMNHNRLPTGNKEQGENKHRTHKDSSPLSFSYRSNQNTSCPCLAWSRNASFIFMNVRAVLIYFMLENMAINLDFTVQQDMCVSSYLFPPCFLFMQSEEFQHREMMTGCWAKSLNHR